MNPYFFTNFSNLSFVNFYFNIKKEIIFLIKIIFKSKFFKNNFHFYNTRSIFLHFELILFILIFII